MKTNNMAYYCYLCNDDHVVRTVDINGGVVEIIPCPKCDRDKYVVLPSRVKYEFVTPNQYNSMTVVNSGGMQESLKDFHRRMKEIRTSLDDLRDMINLTEITAITSALASVGVEG